MPKDNIERAIKRGTGESKDGGELEQVYYEGYANHGVAMMIEVVTDNRNRAVAEIGISFPEMAVTWQMLAR